MQGEVAVQEVPPLHLLKRGVEVNGWQELMDLLNTLYEMGMARQKAAREAEGLALRQDLARLTCNEDCDACQQVLCTKRYFDARWPRLEEVCAGCIDERRN